MIGADLVPSFDLDESAVPRRLLVVGAPLDGSGTARGEVRAPARLRAAGLVGRVGATDFGDLSVEITDPTVDRDSGVRGYRELVAASRTIADAVSSALSAGWRPLLLGGCCSILPGAIRGARRFLGPIALVFVDGHLDLYDGASSPTGEATEMDLAMVLGHGPTSLVAPEGEAPLVAPGDVIALGDGDRPNRILAKAPGPADLAPDLRVVPGAEISRHGPRRQGEEVATAIGGGSAPFWLHLDIDVVDASAVPPVTSPASTGLSWEDVGELLGPLLGSPRLVGLTVTDYNPDQERDGDQAERIIALLARGLTEAGEGAD